MFNQLVIMCNIIDCALFLKIQQSKSPGLEQGFKN